MKKHDNLEHDNLAAMFEVDSMPIHQSEASKEIAIGLATVIAGTLQDTSLAYLPAEETSFDALEKSLVNLANNATFDFDLFDQAMNERLTHEARSTFMLLQSKAIRAVQRGKAEVVDEETNKVSWKEIPSAVRSRFVQALSDSSIDSEHVFLKQETPSELSDTEMHHLISSIGSEFIQKLADLIEVIPTIEQLKSGKLDGIRLLLNPFDATDSKQGILQCEPNNRTVAVIRKKVIKLKNMIDTFAENPTTYAANRVFESNKESILKEITSLVQGALLKSTTDLYFTLSTDDLAKVKVAVAPEEVAKPSKEALRRSRTIGNQALLQSADISQPDATPEVASEREVSNVAMRLPWIDGGAEFISSATEARSNGQTIYVINGMEEKLQHIATNTLDKEEIATKITGAINNQVSLMLAGYMPWERHASNIKSVTKNGKAPKVYRDETIWYTHDLRPNAPRVYFIVKNASEIETTATPLLQPDAKCMIVVAITDKSQQLTVLRRFTGQNRASLTARGAGSV